MAIEPDHKVGDNNYYRGEANQIPTVFDGKTARLLCIHGTFDLDADDRLFRGFAPDLKPDGKEQKLVARIDKDRVGAVDWTFNRPKSVSALKLVAADTRIDDVECKAELKAIRYIERQARVRVRKRAEIDKSKSKMPKGWKYPERKTDNILFVRYRHPGSREDDPHSHTHVKIFNISYDREEKIFKALELRYVDRAGANEVYQAEMRKGLHQLGYKTEKAGREFEVVGFPAEVKAKYSRRSDQITGRKEAIEAKTGRPMSARSKAKLPVIDRPDKPADRPLEERRAGWLSRITHEQYDGLRGLVAKARAAVKKTRWREESRSAFDRMRGRGIPRGDGAPSLERGRNDNGISR